MKNRIVNVEQMFIEQNFIEANHYGICLQNEKTNCLIKKLLLPRLLDELEMQKLQKNDY